MASAAGPHWNFSCAKNGTVSISARGGRLAPPVRRSTSLCGRLTQPHKTHSAKTKPAIRRALFEHWSEAAVT